MVLGRNFSKTFLSGTQVTPADTDVRSISWRMVKFARSEKHILRMRSGSTFYERGERVQRYWFRVLHTFLLVAEATIEVAETRTYFMNLSDKVWRSIDFPSKKCQSIWRNLFHKWKKCILLRLRPLNPWPVSWNSCQLTKVSNIWIFLRLGRIVESMWGDEHGTSRDWEGMTCFAQITIYLNWSYLILTQ